MAPISIEMIPVDMLRMYASWEAMSENTRHTMELQEEFKKRLNDVCVSYDKLRKSSGKCEKCDGFNTKCGEYKK